MSNPVQIKAQQKRRARERMLKQVSEVVVELQDPQAAKKKATQDTAMQEPAKKKAAKRVSVLVRAGGRSPKNP